jgi:hypothetical protein
MSGIQEDLMFGSQTAPAVTPDQADEMLRDAAATKAAAAMPIV